MSNYVNYVKGLKMVRAAYPLNFLGPLTCGTSAAPNSLTYSGDKALAIYSTCASTHASTSFEPVLFNTVMTGTGQVGGRVRVNLDISNVVLGGWANALKASVDCNTSGRSSGLLSAMCAEIELPASDVSGAAGDYAAAELEFTAPASHVTKANCTSFLYMGVGGNSTAITSFNTYGSLFKLSTAIVDTTDGLFDAITSGSPAFTHRLRIYVGNTPYYIGLNSAPAFGD